jgi:hypothetical protein
MLNNAICLNFQGKPRRAYLNQQWAEEGSHHAFSTYGKRMVPYHCDQCGSWHLCPANRHTPGHYCHNCSKQAYVSENAAQLRALILEQEKGILLRVYECPYSEGWNLTSKL